MAPNLRVLTCFLFLSQVVQPACVDHGLSGLEALKITDRQIKSIGTVYEDYGATEVRLDSGKGWCSLNNESQPQLIIDFNNIVTISKIGTQGISSNGTSIFASKYRVQFGYNGNDWYDYKAKDGKVVLNGNSDSMTVVNNTIHDTMARFMKILPIFSAAQDMICLKMEVYGCKLSLKPSVETRPEVLTLRNEQTGSIQCHASGQVGMNAKWSIHSHDKTVTGYFESNSTNGIFYNETRMLSLKKAKDVNITADGNSCSVDMKQAAVVCKKNYTCKAEYSFDSNASTEKKATVFFQIGVSVTVIVNRGDNSPVYLAAKKFIDVPCSARSRDPVTMKWYHKRHPEWASNVKNSTNKMQGHLNYFREAMLTLSPKAADVIDKLSCTKFEHRVHAVQCPTKFSCKAYYHWNSSIMDERELDVYFVVRLPTKPDSLQEDCGNYNCTITWSQSQAGDLPKASISYRFTVKEESKVIMEKTVKGTSFLLSGLLPNRQYTVIITAQVKDGGGKLWTSEAAEEKFRTRPLPPKSDVKFMATIATNDSLTFRWQRLVLPRENGKLLKYDYRLEQLKYGDSQMPFVDSNWQGNVDSDATMYQYKGLKPWSTYSFAIVPVNTHRQQGRSTIVSASTKEYVPSKPPSNVEAHVQATEILLEWQEPAFEYRNGRIIQYHIKWDHIKWNQRGRRNSARYDNRIGTTREFQCGRRVGFCKTTFTGLQPFQKYVFKIAAKTSQGLGPFTRDMEVLTTQAAPSAPVSPSYNKSSSTFYLTWKEPIALNGIITEYEVEMEVDTKIKADFTMNTFYDTKLNSPETLKFRVRGYTEFLHNKGGHPGKWTPWTIAKRFSKPDDKVPGHGKMDKTALAIGLSFTFVILVVIVTIILLFFLYRRKERGGSRKRLEVEMDSVAEGGSGEGLSEEKTPLTQNHGIREMDDSNADGHTAVPIDEFQVYVSRMRENDDELITHQYKELMSGKCYSTEIGQRPENKLKNRYVNIAAYDHSRVILKPEGKKIIHHSESDYFNANHVEGYCPQSSSKYIASQGPMESVFVDFWRMIWQENITVIIMLTKREEGGHVKCDQYWPSKGACRYGHITVRFNRVDQTADYFIRTFEIEKGTGKDKIKRTLMQFHFISWPDYGVPEFPTAILSLRRRVRHNYTGESPMLVHCSAGVGRTGCFILIDAMLEGIDNGEGSIDIFNHLQYMRTRRINMVQTLDQYIFAHLSILEYLTFGDTEITATDFERKFKILQKENGIEREFELIQSTTPDLESIDNSCKVLLKTGKFIDVFYVDGYKQRDAFFISNSPSANMTPDFWKMLIEHNCHTVVMLNRLEDEENYKYWPDMNTHLTYDNYSVVMIFEQLNGNIVTRKFKITSSESPEEHFELQHFQFLDWPSDDVPKSKDSILTLMSLIEKSRQNYGNGPVLVHSGNGAGRSGTLIAIYNSTERLKVEQLIDIPQCVRAIRTVVPNAITVRRQYEFIYEMIRTYLEAFETYSNFSDPTMSMVDYS